MLHKTKGICINFLKYRETSIIAKIYTEEFGMQSYLINSVRTAKPKFGIALFQPLTLLDMVVYHKPAKSVLQRIAEVRSRELYLGIPFDIKKTSLAIFLSEILLKTLHEEEPNKELFDFLEQSFLTLDKSENINNFAIRFLMLFLEKQGLLGQDVKHLFEELNKNKTSLSPEKLQEEIKYLANIRNGVEVELPNSLRQRLINYLLDYFRLHYEFFGEVKSLQVLRSIF
jgi:DNA repair protein RecO (recombination protein O)